MLPQPSKKFHLPKSPPLRQILGPSFVLLGLGLGSGEVILWPYLVSNHGLGIIWGMVVGITLQFFINTEIMRYALINGESIFVGWGRQSRLLPLWFIASTLAGFLWPGIGLAGITLLTSAAHITLTPLLSITVFILLGLVLSIGKSVYQTVESIQKVLILIGVPCLFVLSWSLATPQNIEALGKGLVGVGDGFQFLPLGISLATFMGALAYSGAGGNLNLAQSFYIRDKGYGMGKHADKLEGAVLSLQNPTPQTLVGHTFPRTFKNIVRFKRWWKIVNIEHFMVFWLTGLISMVSLSFLSYASTYKQGIVHKDINFVLVESNFIGNLLHPAAGIFFLLLTGAMLLGTQLTILDSTSRIITENLFLLRHQHRGHPGKYYFFVLWSQILLGCAVILLGIKEPIQLITLGAVVNGLAMGIFTILLLILNNQLRPVSLRPSLLRKCMLVAASLLLFSLFFVLL